MKRPDPVNIVLIITMIVIAYLIWPRGREDYSHSRLARIFHKLSGFSRLARVPEEKSGGTALVFRFRHNSGLNPL